jgi:hypothetical protein
VSGEIRNAYKILVVNPEVKRPLPKLCLRSQDNIRMDKPIKDIGYKDID